ncbi:MAG: SDR family oxidoreductase [Lentisphaerae bacterium]|nr:SDR family oxidoreductase [Lentisphaerota bacterium]
MRVVMSCYEDLKDKKVLVTGASRGIGAGVVRAFSEAGAKVFLHYRSDRALAEKIASELPGEVHLFRADLGKAEELEALFEAIKEKFGTLDAAVNNAGVVLPALAPEEITDEYYHQLADVNIRGTLFCCLREIALMRGKGGSIINIGSVHQDTTVPGWTLYAMSKGAIHGMTGQLAIQEGKNGIRVNNILPGYIDVDKDPVDEAVNMSIPVRRVGMPADIAGCALFLASEKSGFINGADITVDGGVSRKLARTVNVF